MHCADQRGFARIVCVIDSRTGLDQFFNAFDKAQRYRHLERGNSVIVADIRIGTVGCQKLNPQDIAARGNDMKRPLLSIHRGHADMPIWFELLFLLMVTYLIGIFAGWVMWGRDITAKIGSKPGAPKDEEETF